MDSDLKPGASSSKPRTPLLVVTPSSSSALSTPLNDSQLSPFNFECIRTPEEINLYDRFGVDFEEKVLAMPKREQHRLKREIAYQVPNDVEVLFRKHHDIVMLVQLLKDQVRVKREVPDRHEASISEKHYFEDLMEVAESLNNSKLEQVSEMPLELAASLNDQLLRESPEHQNDELNATDANANIEKDPLMSPCSTGSKIKPALKSTASVTLQRSASLDKTVTFNDTFLMSPDSKSFVCARQHYRECRRAVSGKERRNKPIWK